MKEFIHEDFLLGSAMARRLYHQHAAGLPIVDFHSHMDPVALADDRRFETITGLWVSNDPYKHRAMRIAGVPERLITGDATDREKFDAWAAVVPDTIGNPLFHWTALELKRYFGVGELLSRETSGRIWDRCNGMLGSEECGARALVSRLNVEVLCTSDGLADGLEAHRRLADSGFKTRVLPSLRVDALLKLTSEEIAKRLDHFQEMGCVVADHGVDVFSYSSGGAESDLLRFMGTEYARRGWVMQLHVGALRQTSTRLRRLVGPAGGYATIGNATDMRSLCGFLDDLEREGALPRVILYPLNPSDYAAFATLTGAFAEDGVRGKIQFGPAWWYNDHAAGIRNHLELLASHGLLSSFVGMTTDSRSPLSMIRHEYFRRVLCDWMGGKVESGLFPADEAVLARLVRRVCYENAREWIAGREIERQHWG